MRTTALLAVLISTTAALLSGCCHRCRHPVPPPPDVGVAPQGVIWVDHASLIDSDPDWDQLVLSSNGTDVFFKARSGPGLTFPAGETPLHGVFIQSHPGLKITGVIACVAAQGDKNDTQLLRLRLSQFDATARGYVVKLEAPVSTSPPVGPPDAPGSFACVDTGSKVCLDSTAGTIDVSLGVQVGDADDAIRLRALGVHYDTGCTPTP
ncbi:MAG: hypothetical protein U0802_25435 [Candidatus Binatia bacterium]